MDQQLLKSWFSFTSSMITIDFDWQLSLLILSLELLLEMKMQDHQRCLLFITIAQKEDTDESAPIIQRLPVEKAKSCYVDIIGHIVMT